MAIAIVVISHAEASLAAWFGVDRVAPLFAAFPSVGFFGVWIFFALSGFLICSRLIQEHVEQGRISLMAFYVRRCFRILPAMFALLFAVAALAWAGVIVVPVKQWIAGATFLANYVRDPGNTWYLSHLWSLSVEEHFYLLFPGLLLIVGVKRGLIASAVLAMVMGAWRLFAYRFTNGPTADPAYFWGRSDIVADVLLWGCVVAFVYATPAGRARLSLFARPAIWWPLAIAVFASVPIRGHVGWLASMSIYQFQAMAIPLVIVGTVLRPDGATGRLLESPTFRWIGKRSYSIYLWQQLVFVNVASHVPGATSPQALPWNFVLTLIAATASYSLLELPLMRLGQRVGRRIAEAGATRAARSDVDPPAFEAKAA